jgi:hypothetical protein
LTSNPLIWKPIIGPEANNNMNAAPIVPRNRKGKKVH